MECTVVGFSAEVDWRPLRFVKPIPQHRVCDACGLVRKSTALLPCRHTLCESCYELSVNDSWRKCPLDGHQFEEEAVVPKKFTAADLLRREVKCWNEETGCRAVLPASEIAQHFQRECGHHSIRCPRCSTTVLCSDVCAHLECECTTAATPPVSEYLIEDLDSSDGAALLTYFRAILKAQSSEIKAHLERLVTDSGASRNGFYELVDGIINCQEELREELQQGIGIVKDTVRQEVVEVITEHRECVEKCSDEIAVFGDETKERFSEGSDTMNTISSSMYALEKLVSHELAKVARGERDKDSHAAGGSEWTTEGVEDSSTRMVRKDNALSIGADLLAPACEFLVTGVKSLIEEASKKGWSYYDSERVYLRGYCISPGVWLCNRSGSAQLSPRFLLHKGYMDDIVQWPLEKTIKLRVLHPKSGREREIVYHTSKLSPTPERSHDGTAQVFFCCAALPVEDLIRDGYFEDDQLRVKFEFFP